MKKKNQENENQIQKKNKDYGTKNEIEKKNIEGQILYIIKF